ncbi:serine/threonine-protein kinase rio3-like [Plakobranchus ocellatus]|uniref:Serine/threonine-protein kinase RIO3 n=1 Tax=Plakobranchus ocellatus TaxID=259542 RepID=A0AAV4BEX0_9GAST|nr:serine/threonine-protein kinase rio3-like [Plakobranchus ocellatus]
MGQRGYAGQGKNIVTKHDKVICGRRNAERLMEFPPEFESGDGEGMDMQLPNRVYNRLKLHSNHETRRGQKVHEKKEHSTAIKAVDQKTRIILFKLLNSGFLAGIDGVVSEGKEAVVFKAAGGEKDEKPLPPHVILKIFKTTMNEFRTRAKYIHGDHRLSSDIYKKQNPRKIMKLWAEKECMNLKRMRRHNIPCPTPISLKKHVLAMTCIGEEHPAPKLKTVKLSTEDMQDAYEQTVEMMKRLYHECGLVHADLSEYNLLWHDGKVWVIDVSQAVEKENLHSNDFLLRDCQNITKFFKQAGVYGVSSPEELFMDVTRYSLKGEGKVFAAEAQKYIKTDYAFDYYFEQREDLPSEERASDNSSDSEDSIDGDKKREADQEEYNKQEQGLIDDGRISKEDEATNADSLTAHNSSLSEGKCGEDGHQYSHKETSQGRGDFDGNDVARQQGIHQDHTDEH